MRQWHMFTILSLREIGNICNTLDRECLRRFVYEHSYLICIHHWQWVKGKYVLGCYVPTWMCNFFLDPNRSRYLYSTSLVIDNCRTAIKSLILQAPNHFNSFFDQGVTLFFTPMTPSHGILIECMVNATHLLESARNGSDRHDELLLFLEYLSGIPWFIYCRPGSDRHQRRLTIGIAHWVCTILVG